MKKLIFPVLVFSCYILTSGFYTKNEIKNIVRETFIHKYGLTVTKSDWVKRGKDGKVVQQHKNGVTVSYNYASGILCGATTWSFPHSSVIQKTEIYENGKLSITSINFESGLKKQEECFKNNELVSLKTWYENGVLKSSETYQDTYLVNCEYSNPQEKIISTVVDGFGVKSTLSLEGILEQQDTIEQGSTILIKQFYPSGDIKELAECCNNIYHGSRKTFLRYGVPQSVESWLCGSKHGITTIFQNGEKAAEISYKNGVKDGLEVKFDSFGKVVEEVSWKHDLWHGERKLFIGKNTAVEWYFKGKLVSEDKYRRFCRLPNQHQQKLLNQNIIED